VEKKSYTNYKWTATNIWKLFWKIRKVRKVESHFHTRSVVRGVATLLNFNQTNIMRIMRIIFLLIKYYE